MLAHDVVDSVELLADVFVTGRLVLNELVMKKLAMIGATCCSPLSAGKTKRATGPPRHRSRACSSRRRTSTRTDASESRGDANQPRFSPRDFSWRRCSSSWARQMSRVVRELRLFAGGRGARRGPKDGHDNNWLLVEFAPGAPLAVGYKSEWTRGAVATLFLEAFCVGISDPGHSRPERGVTS